MAADALAATMTVLGAPYGSIPARAGLWNRGSGSLSFTGSFKIYLVIILKSHTVSKQDDPRQRRALNVLIIVYQYGDSDSSMKSDERRRRLFV